MEQTAYKPNRTTRFFYKINMVAYVLGVPNFWIEDLKLSKTFVKIYDRISAFNNFMVYLWIILEYGALFTQNNLNKKQHYNLLVFVISHPILCSYRLLLTHNKEMITAQFYNLSIALKRIYNNPEIEKRTVTKTRAYLAALVSGVFTSMVMYTFDAIVEVLQYRGTFTISITAYPDVHNNSYLANVVRGISYLIWWIFISRACGVYLVVVSLTTSLGHQYKNLQSYFYNLNDIFNREDLSQTEKEIQYEEQFRSGIQIHVDTKRCVRELRIACRGVFSGQIVFNLVILILLMVQMVKSERSLSNLFATLISASAVLATTGFFMWNAGDVTVEASRLSSAIYFSGWENCHGQSAVRIRKMVTVAMNLAQIVKASYSIFSVLA